MRTRYAILGPHVDLPGAYLPILSSPPPAGQTGRPRHSPNGPVTASLSEANAKRQGWVRQRIRRSLAEALAALDRGECAIVLADRVVAAHSIRMRNYLHVVATDLAALGLDQELHRAVHPSAPALLNRLNKGLAHLRENGTDQRIYDKRIRPLETRHLRSRDGQPYRLGLGARARDSRGLGGATPPAPSTRRKARRTAHARGKARSPTSPGANAPRPPWPIARPWSIAPPWCWSRPRTSPRLATGKWIRAPTPATGPPRPIASTR